MTTNQTAVQTVTAKDITDTVLAKVEDFRKAGELKIPENYAPENALKSAMLILKETVDSNKRPVLEICTRESIANSLLDMVVQGLTPMKKQCYFIAYGTKLQMQRSYFGDIALAKNVSNVENVVAQAIYKGDDFKYSIDPETGIKKVVSHQQLLENVGGDVIGAYAIATLENGKSYVEIMNIKQIHAAWNQGTMKGGSPAHKNFSDEMACKTVTRRLCKRFINSSDDGYLADENEPKTVEDKVSDTIEEQANKTPLTFDDAEVVNNVEQSHTEEPSHPEAAEEQLKTTPKNEIKFDKPAFD